MPNERILDDIQRLCAYQAERDKLVVVCHPVIPSMNDDESNWEGMARFMAGLEGGSAAQRAAYHNLGEAKYEMIGERYEVAGLSMMKKGDETIARLQDVFAHVVLKVRLTIGGRPWTGAKAP